MENQGGDNFFPVTYGNRPELRMLPKDISYGFDPGASQDVLSGEPILNHMVFEDANRIIRR
jgi:hypothetical protein